MEEKRPQGNILKNSPLWVWRKLFEITAGPSHLSIGRVNTNLEIGREDSRLLPADKRKNNFLIVVSNPKASSKDCLAELYRNLLINRNCLQKLSRAIELFSQRNFFFFLFNSKTGIVLESIYISWCTWYITYWYYKLLVLLWKALQYTREGPYHP